MRRIATELITATSGYPIDGNSTNKRTGIDFLQLREDERFAAVCESIIGGGFTLSQMYIMSGQLTIGGGFYSCTGGWAYIRHTSGVNELIHLQTVSPPVSMGGNTYLNVTVSETADLDDPIEFSDAASQSPHKVRTAIFTPSSSPSSIIIVNGLFTALPEASTWQYTALQNLLNLEDFRNLQFPTTIGTVGGFDALSKGGFTVVNNTGGGGNVAYTTPNDGITRNYLVIARINVLMTYDGSNACNPQFKILVGGVIHSFTHAVGTSNSATDVVLTYGAHIPPNTLIQVQAWDDTPGGSVSVVQIAELNVYSALF